MRLLRRRREWAERDEVPPNAAIGFLLIYLTLLLLIPAQLVFRPLGAPGTPANIWAIGGLVWWGCVTVGGLNPGGRTTPTRIATALFGAAALAAYANGMASGWYAPLTNRQSSDEDWTLLPQPLDSISATILTAADRGLLSLAGWLGVVLVAAEGIRRWRELELVVAAMTWLGAVVAAVGIVQFFTGIDIVSYIQIPGLSLNNELGGLLDRSVLTRVSSTAVHPIEFGVAMACLLPLALHRTIHLWGQRGVLLPTALIFVGAFLSVSRSAILAMAVIGVVLFLGWPNRWRLRAIVLFPVAVVGMRIAIPGLVGTILALFTNLNNDPSISGRTSDYPVVFDVYEDHPWFGRGLFTFLPRSYRILDNQWLMLLLELGFVGLLAFLVFLLTAFFAARSAHRHAATARSRHLGLVLSSAIAGAAVSMVTYDAWTYRMHSGLSFLVIGLAGAAWRLGRQDRADALERADTVQEPDRVRLSN